MGLRIRRSRGGRGLKGLGNLASGGDLCGA